jgi:toluene monooxygenase system ferredoxin subunit
MSKIRLCSTADIPANGMKGYAIDGGRRILIVNAGDTYYAYQGICPHQEVCLDEGFFDGSVLTCHQHLWQWNIETGEPVGMAEAPIERYPLEIVGTEIFVTPTAT